MPKNPKVVILGAGLSGLSCAYHLKDDYEIYEKEEACGGLCRSSVLKGFTFDMAGHLLHFRQPSQLSLVRNLLEGNLKSRPRDSRVWFDGRFIPYPFQCHLKGLPAETIAECVKGFQRARARRSPAQERGDAENLKAWLLHRFGAGFTRHFFFPYNKKFWHMPLDRLTADWAKRFIPVPTLAEVRAGAYGDLVKRFGYNTVFWYPDFGGIQSLIDGFRRHLKDIHTGHEAVRMDLKKKEIFFRNGHKTTFDILVSTVPLPEIARMLTAVPSHVKRAFAKLRFVSVFNVNLGLIGIVEPRSHWAYYPQKSLPFYRLGFYSNFSGHSAPPGATSMYAEAAYIADRGFDRRRSLRRILSGLPFSGFGIRHKDIAVIQINDIKYGYCIYDRDRRAALETLGAYLKGKGVWPIGRYGSWSYASMEDVMIESQRTARELTGRHKSISKEEN